MNSSYKISLFGSNAIRIHWEPMISQKLSELIVALNTFLNDSLKDVIQETHFTYHELVVYTNVASSTHKVMDQIERILQDYAFEQDAIEKEIYTIPVCYDEDLGWDLETVCKQHNISKSELIEYHTAPLYPIHFIGFLPGFPYLGGLNERIATPRKKTPRTKIPAGAVGIAGAQTGIYPISSPGGWNLIGRTPIPLFDPNAKTSALLKPGNYVSFNSISVTEYKKIQKEVEAGTFILKKTYHQFNG